MGKKIPYDQALEAAKAVQNDSIYALSNKYGYRININHPQIKPMYERYKQKIGAIILSDSERLQFEELIFKLIEKGKKEE